MCHKFINLLDLESQKSSVFTVIEWCIQLLGSFQTLPQIFTLNTWHSNQGLAFYRSVHPQTPEDSKSGCEDRGVITLEMKAHFDTKSGLSPHSRGSVARKLVQLLGPVQKFCKDRVFAWAGTWVNFSMHCDVYAYGVYRHLVCVWYGFGLYLHGVWCGIVSNNCGVEFYEITYLQAKHLKNVSIFVKSNIVIYDRLGLSHLY